MDLAQWIRPGDGVVFGQACAEPQTLVEALVAQRAAVPGATLFMGVNWSGIVKPAACRPPAPLGLLRLGP